MKMMIYQKKINILLFFGFLLILTGCSEGKKLQELEKEIESSGLSKETILDVRNSIALELFEVSYESLIKTDWIKVAKDTGLTIIESLFTIGGQAPISTQKRIEESSELTKKMIEINTILLERIKKGEYK